MLELSGLELSRIKEDFLYHGMLGQINAAGKHEYL